MCLCVCVIFICFIVDFILEVFLFFLLLFWEMHVPSNLASYCVHDIFAPKKKHRWSFFFFLQFYWSDFCHLWETLRLSFNAGVWFKISSFVKKKWNLTINRKNTTFFKNTTSFRMEIHHSSKIINKLNGQLWLLEITQHMALRASSNVFKLLESMSIYESK